jgi:hypothetical protein
MNRLILSTLGAALPALTIGVTRHAEAGSIRGAWRTVEVTVPGPNGVTHTSVQPNLVIVTAKHYSRVEVHAGARPILTDVATATADDLRAAWGPFVAEAGTYDVTGDVITMRPIVAKDPAATARATFRVFSYKVAGDTIWLTAERTEKGPVAERVKVKAVRVEQP